MMSIGEFARLAGVSVRMLRHYDQLGLLTPHRVDPFTGYRFYTAAQLEHANRLVALKELGFGLDQVGELLGGGLSPGRVAELLRERRDQLRSQIDADRRRLRQIQSRLSTIERSTTMSVPTYTEVALPALRLAQLSARISEMEQIEAQIGPMFDRVNAAVAASRVARTGCGVATYTTDGEGMVAAAGEQVAGPVEGLEWAEVDAAARALSCVYTAPDLDGIQAAWQGLVAELERRGLSPAGTAREVYHQTPFDPAGQVWRVELQQPVG